MKEEAHDLMRSADWLWVAPALIGLLAWLGPYVDFRRSGWKMRYLEEQPVEGPASLPSLSVIVPALDEEATIEPAMRSLLGLDYPGLEIVAIDDRSSDRTGEILDNLAAQHVCLHVKHVAQLPPGWLGKNHALHLGAGEAMGDYLLFTDADVHFEPSALSRAVRFAASNQLDHLVVLPRLVLHGTWETICIWFFGVIFTLTFRPWRVADPASRHFTGVGAFNLVRAKAYRQAGGHASFPMDVGDDVKLGKRMKQAGGRADVIISDRLVRVRWVEGVRGLITGLTKNMFAGLDFNPLRALGASIGLVLLAVWPVAGLFVGPLVSRALCGLTVLVMVMMSAQGRPYRGAPPILSLGFPVAALVMIYIILRSMVATYRQGGIVWRGTHYPLKQLRDGIV